MAPESNQEETRLVNIHFHFSLLATIVSQLNDGALEIEEWKKFECEHTRQMIVKKETPRISRCPQELYHSANDL
jgi:hypothetical protein